MLQNLKLSLGLGRNMSDPGARADLVLSVLEKHPIVTKALADQAAATVQERQKAIAQRDALIAARMSRVAKQTAEVEKANKAAIAAEAAYKAAMETQRRALSDLVSDGIGTDTQVKMLERDLRESADPSIEDEIDLMRTLFDRLRHANIETQPPGPLNVITMTRSPGATNWEIHRAVVMMIMDEAIPALKSLQLADGANLQEQLSAIRAKVRYAVADLGFSFSGILA